MSDDAQPPDLEAHLQAVDDVSRVRMALRVLDSMPADELRHYAGPLSIASCCADFDSDDNALVASLWRTLDHRPGLIAFMTSVMRRGPRQARRLVDECGIAGDELVELVRGALDVVVRDEARLGAERRRQQAFDDDLDEDPTSISVLTPPTSPVANGLREWLNELQGIAPRAARLDEYRRASLRLGNWDATETMAFVELLAAVDHDDDVTLSIKAQKAFAADIGQVVMSERTWPHLLLLVRHIDRLGLEPATLQRVLAQVLAVSMATADETALAIVLGLVGSDDVVHEILAYNLACHAAKTGDRDRLLRFTTLALSLGKTISQFKDDHDFDAWRDDPAFAALLVHRAKEEA